MLGSHMFRRSRNTEAAQRRTGRWAPLFGFAPILLLAAKGHQSLSSDTIAVYDDNSKSIAMRNSKGKQHDPDVRLLLLKTEDLMV